ncbi:MAG: hypothetical protein AAGE18_01105 [Pseudomonadota bacterium]
MRWLLPCLVLLLTAPLSAQAEELAERAKIRERVMALVEADAFDEIERLAATWREEETRTSSGLWRLTVMHWALEGTFWVEGPDDPRRAVLEDRLERWAEAAPSSSTRIVAEGYLLHRIAWAVRGNGFANTVSRPAWQGFREWTAKAINHLEANRHLAVNDPAWWALMVEVHLAAGTSRLIFDRFVAEALERHPRYYQLHFHALFYYTPRWYGSPSELDERARISVEATRETDGAGLYARSYWYLWQVGERRDFFERHPVDWPLMRAGIYDVVDVYPADWNLSTFAYFACEMQDRRTYDDLLARMTGKPEARIQVSGNMYQVCRLGE